MPREEHPSLCVRIPWSECVSTDARAEKAIPRANDSQHHVPGLAGSRIHAQAQLFTPRSQAWELALLPPNSEDRRLRVSDLVVPRHFLLKFCLCCWLDWRKRWMQDHLLLIMWAQDGTVRQRFSLGIQITTHRSIFSPWAASWQNCLQCDHSFPASQSKIRWLRSAKYSALRLGLTGQTDSN